METSPENQNDDVTAAILVYLERSGCLPARSNGPGGAAGGKTADDAGIPAQPAPGDDHDFDSGDLKRWRALLQAAWTAWDDAAAAAEGVTLSVGPRGGGRTLVKMTTHVLEAEQAYLRQLGSKPPAGEDMTALREAALAALAARAKKESPPNPNQVKKPRYYGRRSAWHVLDHAWELADRSRPS